MGIRLKNAIATVVAAGALALPVSQAARAQPTPDQVSAIRSSCRSDFMANCSGVTPGGKDALECLKHNVSKLSGACQTAVNAVSPPAAPAAAPPAAAPAPAPAPSAAPAPAMAPPAAPKPASAPAAPKPAAKQPTAVAAPTAKPTAAQTSAIRAACRSDFMAHCSGVTPGGAEALQCLQRNAAQLSGACRSAVAAIGGGETPATSGMAAPPIAAAAPSGFPPLGPVRPVLPRRAFMIVEICRADAQVLCPGIPPGGGRILSCLAENGPRLSPECYKTLAPITQ